MCCSRGIGNVSREVQAGQLLQLSSRRQHCCSCHPLRCMCTASGSDAALNMFFVCPTLPSLMAAICCALMTLDAGAAAASTPPATAIRLLFFSRESVQQPAASISSSGMMPLLPIKTS